MEPTSSALEALTRRRSALWLLALAGVLWAAPSLELGLLLDDRGHRDFVQLHLASDSPGRAAIDMFGLGRNQGAAEVRLKAYVGLLPWWTSETFSVSFFRPLAVATHFLDYGLWPEHPWLMHAHNLLWYGAMLLCVGMLYRRLMGSSVAAALALLLFALDEAHVEGASWLAGRNTLMTGVFVLAALLLHHRARTNPKTRSARWLAPLALLFGFASSEGTITAWAYLLPYALLMDHGPLRARLLSLWPLAAVTVGWQALYRALGYGARGSTMYVDPGSDPLRFLAAVVERYPSGLRQQFVLSAPRGWTADMLALGGLVFVVALFFVIARRRREATFFLVGSLLAALPLCTVAIAPRLLFPVSIGACGFLAHVLLDGIAALRDRRVWARPLGLSLAATVLAFHVAAPLAFTRLVAPTMAAIDEGIAKSAATLPWDASVAGSVLAILNAPNFFMASLELQDRVQRDGPVPRVVYLLGTSETPVQLSRPDTHTLLLTPVGGYLLESWSTLVRAPDDPFEVGDAVQLGGITVTVDAITGDGRPARVRLDYHERESPIAWVTWNGDAKRYERIELPPVGSSIVMSSAPL